MELGRYNKTGKVEFDESRALNRSVFISGKSGSGKSTAAQKLILNMAKAGQTVLAFDYHMVLAKENIYEGIRKEFEKYVNIIDLYEAPMPLPLFDSITYADGRSEADVNTVGAVVDVIKRIYRLGEVQQAELRKACQYCYTNGLYKELGMRAIEEALKIMGGKVASRLCDKLYMLFAQPLFVDGEAPIEEGKINIIRLNHLDAGTQRTIAEIILSFVWRRTISMSQKENLVVYLDEVQNISIRTDSPLRLMLTEGRKYHLSLILCTQSLGMYFSDSQQRAIMQSGLLLFFKPTDIERRSTAALISSNQVSDYALVLSTLKIGEAIAVGELLLNGKRQLTPIKVSF